MPDKKSSMNSVAKLVQSNQLKEAERIRKQEESTVSNYVLPKINLVPFDSVGDYDIRPGFYEINGATAIPCGVNFTVHSVNAKSCELLLFRPAASKPFAVIKFPDNYRIGNVYSMIVFGLSIGDFEYAYRLDGPYDPKRGLIFNKNAYLLDPYAKAVAGQDQWGRERGTGEIRYRARVVQDDFDWDTTKQTLIPMEDLIIYEMHVRGFTRHESSDVKHPGTFAGMMEKIPYLKDLGVNAVELMPIFEFDETLDSRKHNGETLMDYWGYNSVCFFAPNASYSFEPEYNHEGNELKRLIKTLKENGIEVILDVVFNHTAEGNSEGPFFSFKGFDNNIYYMLTPDGKYYNFSGCGNTLNCNHPIVQQMILECLRYWAISYRVDGFRFDLASILGRNEDGSPMNKPPLLQSLAFDPILGSMKLIAEAWDAGGMYQVGSFPSWNRWAEWNGKYRDDMRGFLKGDGGLVRTAAERITGSTDLYDPTYRGKNASVNFITCHDGFTLYDLYSYNQKHNERNGWNNCDGTDDNRSWNCGAEGETDNPEVRKLRYRLIKNSCAVLLCSRGTPMFLAGDEFCNTQFGNNNPYCQDNEVSWLDWRLLNKNLETFEFFRYMIAFRKKHSVIRSKLEPCSAGFPDVSFHSESAWTLNADYNSRTLGVMFAGSKNGEDDIVFLAVNTDWEWKNMHMPNLPDNMSWYLMVDTTGDKPEGCFSKDGSPLAKADNNLWLSPRSVSVFIADIK